MQRLTLKVIPNAKQNEIKGEKVYLTAPPVEGKANAALIDFLATHFQVKKRQVRIVHGLHARNKVVLVDSSNKVVGSY